ncbi:hypothetical protein B0A49_03333 [Cryomyces minteri]|uniref:BRCT domain-containing protein n=1 Tax=Cryomyces minteri TaxID=331657 RepID=A0A4U0XEU9_9PEZI|nr:hypothetical protein B0A49_03333 [Cryomyces minteri]
MSMSHIYLNENRPDGSTRAHAVQVGDTGNTAVYEILINEDDELELKRVPADNLSSNCLAALYAAPYSLQLEFIGVDGVIRPPGIAYSNISSAEARWHTPASHFSRPGARVFNTLRPDDTIHFQGKQLELMFSLSIEREAQSSSGPEVQVDSSAPANADDLIVGQETYRTAPITDRAGGHELTDTDIILVPESMQLPNSLQFQATPTTATTEPEKVQETPATRSRHLEMSEAPREPFAENALVNGDRELSFVLERHEDKYAPPSEPVMATANYELPDTQIDDTTSVTNDEQMTASQMLTERDGNAVTKQSRAREFSLSESVEDEPPSKNLRVLVKSMVKSDSQQEDSQLSILQRVDELFSIAAPNGRLSSPNPVLEQTHDGIEEELTESEKDAAIHVDAPNSYHEEVAETPSSARRTSKRKASPGLAFDGGIRTKKNKPNEDTQDSRSSDIVVVRRRRPLASKGEATSSIKPLKSSPSALVSAKDTPVLSIEENIVAPKSTAGSRTSDQERSSNMEETSAPTSTARLRTSLQTSTQPTIYQGPAPVIVFSNSSIPNLPALMKFLRSQSASVADTVTEKGSNFLCVGKGEVKTTGKVLLSLAFGKTVVTDEWVSKSSDAKSCFTQPKILYFTPSLRKDYGGGFKEIEKIAKAVGAARVISKPPRELPAISNGTSEPETIVLALEHGDSEVSILSEKGWTCYRKELLSNSILRGHLDLASDEFKIQPSASQQKKRKRKS